MREESGNDSMTTTPSWTEDQIEAAARALIELSKAMPDASAHETARAALTAAGSPPAPAVWQLVPTSAIKWLMGEAPDANGSWFGDEKAAPLDGQYWWRTKFEKMLASPPQAAQMEWRTADSAPKQKWVLVCNPKYGDLICAGWQRNDGEWCDHARNLIAPQPTHWMPLPPPPSTPGESR